MKEYRVEEENKGIRLDKAILLYETELSRAMVQKMLQEEKILVNGSTCKPSYRMQVGDIIQIENLSLHPIDVEPQNIPIEVLYEDKDIIVVNKAKGMVVHPAAGNQDGTLVNALLYYCRDSLSGIGGEIRPGIVHRLDKDTSGVLLIAKNDKAHIGLSEQIKNREMKKTYVALVRGIMKEEQATICMPIARSKKDRKKMAVDKNGKEAITHFKVLARYQKYTLLEVEIETGRTHQIRVHLSQIGYPIVGDPVYSNGKNEFGITGQCLHAERIEFKHPINGNNMKIEAPLPTYLKGIIEKLEVDRNN